MHIFNCTSDSIPYGPWLDCFHQQTDLGPYWVTLSDGTRDIAWRQILTWNKQLMITTTCIYPSGNGWHVGRRPHDHCAIALALPQDDHSMSVRFYWPSKGIMRRPCGLLMPRLHLPYDEYTMSKSPFPCGLRRETLRPSYGFTGIVASTILFNSAQWQVWKNRKPVARRHVVVTSYDPRRGTTQWS